LGLPFGAQFCGIVCFRLKADGNVRVKEKVQDGIIIFEERAIVIPVVFALGAVFLLYKTTEVLLARVPDYGDATGSAIVAAVFFAAAIFISEQSRFAFDRGRQRILWSRTNLFTSKSGEIRFQDVTRVEIQSMSRGNTRPTYRIMLRTRCGNFGMTRGYSGGADKWQPIADRILEIIDTSNTGEASDPVEFGVEGLVRDGHLIQAVLQLRDTKGLSLGEARALVEHIDSEQDQSTS
jgi:hypothetical protein